MDVSAMSLRVARPEPAAGAPALASRDPSGAGLAVVRLYNAYADYIFRSLRRLGVDEASLQDALQEVFIVVHRRLDESRSPEQIKRWLFVIAMGVASNYRRAAGRKRPERSAAGIDPDTLASRLTDDPFEQLAHAQQVHLFYRLLETLDDDKRAVFVLAELEQVSVAEIAETLSVNVNTAHARLRAARRLFGEALSRHRAREERGR
jgi:RNA polymerase sigma-70 factor (ECF subfamily)